MKTLFSITMLFLVLGPSIYGQSGSINNTLGAGGSFTIKDGSTTFFTLSQPSGTITLPSVAAGGQIGSIFKGSDRFIHTYFGSGTAGWNTFVGIRSGNFSLGGTGNEGSNNTAVGSLSLTSLTTGDGNSAFGVAVLNRTTTGYANSAFGSASLEKNTSGNNNSAFGAGSLNSNTTGFANSAFGGALYWNTSGYANAAFGWMSLNSNTTGNSNTAFGDQSLYNSTGNNNTAFGAAAGIGITNGSNNTVIGYGADVPSPAGSNQVRIGNSAVSYAGIQVAWSITSDKRSKSNISNCALGLDFIERLRPVSYVRINDDHQRTEYGFIAQEIEQVLKEAGVEDAGMLTVDDDGRYELRYNDLLAPIIKAMQELESENDALKKEITQIRGTIAEQVKEEVRNALLNALRAEEPIIKASLQTEY